MADFSLPAPAEGAFPGANGKVAFQSSRDDVDPSGCITRFPSCDWEIYVMNADGSGQTRLTSPPGNNGTPAWSPDGSKIAFVSLRDGNAEVYVMNADGTGQTRLTSNPASDGNPAWSPDGTKIAFMSTRDSSRGEIYVMNADGTSIARLTSNNTTEREPAWSPDGGAIAFQRQVCDIDFDCAGDIFSMKPDGSGATNLTNTPPPAHDELPEWSPDGGTIAYFKDFETVSLINRDGSGARPMPGAAPGDSNPAWSPDGRAVAVASNEYYDVVVVDLSDGTRQTLTPSNSFETSPDWQPIPINGYPRPKGATPFQTYLTVAYKPCASPNSQHGAPLAVLSCSPPQQVSDFLTVGTLDSNGQAAKSVGSVRYDVKPGNPATPADEADVKLAVSIKDVRMKSDLSDYAGELAVTSSRRITDKDNTPAPDGTTGAATTQDTPFSITVPCAPTTADNTIGSLCAISTTADAIVPGQVKENLRSNWELGQVRVYDGGADADADTTADNTLFMDEGVFVP